MKIFCLGKPPKYKLGQWISTIVVSFCFFSSGMAVGWSSPAFIKVRKKEVALELSEVEMGLLAALPFFSRFLSPIPSSYVMDCAGRRGCLTMGRVLQILHWVMMYSTYNIWVLYVARFISGWYSGMGAFITGVYVGETTHKMIRGRMQAMLNINFLLGAFFVATIGSIVSYELLIVISGVLDFLTFIFMFFIPETPYFLLKYGRYKEAEVSLKWLRGRADVTKELNRIDRYLKRQLVNSNDYSFLFRHQASRRAFYIVQTLLILQRCAGMVVIVSYGSFITPDTSWLPNYRGPIVLNFTYLIMCILSSFFIDKWGRKTLLIFSTSGGSVFMLCCTVWFGLHHFSEDGLEGTEYLPIAFLIGQAAFYSCGFCYIPAIIMSEMFPMNIKAKANALGTMSATFFSTIVLFIFPPLTSAFGMYVNFLIYTCATAMTAVFSLGIIETRGKTLETIQANLEGRIASDSSISMARPSEENEEEIT